MAAKLAGVLFPVLACVLQVGFVSAQDAGAGTNLSLGPVAERLCRSLKLRAVADHYSCLLKAADAGGKPSQCTARFVRQFEQADRLSPGCGRLDDVGRTNALVQSQTEAVLAPEPDAQPCVTPIQTNTAGNLVYCQLTTPSESSSTSSVVLSDVVAQLSTYGVTTSTVMWVQAWGGNGGASHDYARGGAGGFAQMITSVADLENQGIVNLYFYLGKGGTHTGPSGGQGGTATIVTAQDLTLTPSSNPFQSMVMLIAGGGGGSGGDGNGLNACAGEAPHYGGAGGVAISSVPVNGQGGVGIGPGSAASVGGQGGNEGVGGAAGGGGQSGQDGFGGNGGEAGAGNGTMPPGHPGWSNTTTSLTFTAGQGGNGSNDNTDCTSGGGGGGGGWGGGGGGAHAGDTSKAEGGGGGGSLGVASTQSDTNAATSATVPSNPNGSSGFVQLVFDLTPVSSQ